MFECNICNIKIIKLYDFIKHVSQQHNDLNISTTTKLLIYHPKNDYITHSIIGDGNCLFRSISYILFGHQEHHKSLRYLTSKYVFYMQKKCNRFRFAPKKMFDNGIWCGEEHVIAAFEMFDVPLMVVENFDMFPEKTDRIINLCKYHQCEPYILHFVRKNCHYQVKLKPNQSHFFSQKRNLNQNLITFDTPNVNKIYKLLQKKMLPHFEKLINY